MSKKRKTIISKSREQPLKLVEEQSLEEVRELPPKTRALHGLLRDSDMDEKDYKA